MYFREIQWKGIVEDFEGITAKLSSATFQLKDLTVECRVFTESLDQSIVCMLHQFSAKKTRNRLGGLEEALFERSPGVGREEQTPNVVVVYPNQVLHYFVLLCYIIKYESECK